MSKSHSVDNISGYSHFYVEVDGKRTSNIHSRRSKGDILHNLDSIYALLSMNYNGCSQYSYLCDEIGKALVYDGVLDNRLL